MLITQVVILLFFGATAIWLGFSVRSAWRREDGFSRYLEKRSLTVLYFAIAFEGACALSAAIAAINALVMIANIIFS
jgi:putative copper export protein